MIDELIRRGHISQLLSRPGMKFALPRWTWLGYPSRETEQPPVLVEGSTEYNEYPRPTQTRQN